MPNSPGSIVIPSLNRDENGRSDRIRTCDPHTPSVVRYQAAPRSDNIPARARTASRVCEPLGKLFDERKH